jgi:hypothetical protein
MHDQLEYNLADHSLALSEGFAAISLSRLFGFVNLTYPHTYLYLIMTLTYVHSPQEVEVTVTLLPEF